MYPTFPSFRRQPPDAPQHRFDPWRTFVCHLADVCLPLGGRSSAGGLTRYPSACWASVAAVPSARLVEHPVGGRSGLRLTLAGSPQRPAESRSSSCGPTVHLQLLRTPPRGDALTFSYRPESACLGRTYTFRIEYTLRRTSVGAPCPTNTVMRPEIRARSPWASPPPTCNPPPPGRLQVGRHRKRKVEKKRGPH